MSDTAKHLVEEVIPDVPIRQWVLSMPYTHRFLLATNPEFLRKTLAIYHRTINRFYLKQAKKKSRNEVFKVFGCGVAWAPRLAVLNDQSFSLTYSLKLKCQDLLLLKSIL
jgi:hypothetical protein